MPSLAATVGGAVSGIKVPSIEAGRLVEADMINQSLERDIAVPRSPREYDIPVPAVGPDMDISFLTKRMKLKHLHAAVAREDRMVSRGLIQQILIMRKLAESAPDALFYRVNPHRVASIVWRALNAHDTSIFLFECLTLFVSRMPYGVPPPELQHVAGARDRTWYMYDFASRQPARRNAARRFATEFELYKEFMEEASTPGGILVLMITNLLERNIRLPGTIIGPYISALKREGFYRDASAIIISQLREAQTMSATWLNKSNVVFPGIAQKMSAIGLTEPSLPTPSLLTSVRHLLNREAIESAIVCAYSASDFGKCLRYYRLLQFLTNTPSTTAVPNLDQETVQALIISYSVPSFRAENPDITLSRRLLISSIARQAYTEGSLSYGMDKGLLDLTKYSDPLLAIAVLQLALRDLAETSRIPSGQPLKIRVISHVELLSQKALAKQRYEAADKHHVQLTGEQRAELRAMLAQMELLSETDPEMVDAGDEAVEKYMSSFADPETGNIKLPSHDAINLHGQVGVPDYLLQRAVEAWLSARNIPYTVDMEYSTIVVSADTLPRLVARMEFEKREITALVEHTINDNWDNFPKELQEYTDPYATEINNDKMTKELSDIETGNGKGNHSTDNQTSS